MKWRATKMTQEERALAERLLDRTTPQDRRIITFFVIFVRMNGLQNCQFVRQLACLAAQMLSHGLKTTTVLTYIRRVRTVKYYDLSPFDRNISKELFSRIEYLGRHEPLKRAAPLAASDAASLVLELKNPLLKAGAATMALSGLRAADVNDIHENEIEITDNFITLILVGGKNRRSRRDTEVIRIIKPAPFDTLKLEIYLFLVKYIFRMRDLIRRGLANRLFDLDTVALSEELTRLSGRPLSSYSLRNGWIKEKIELYRDDDGTVDWKKVMAHSLHHDQRSLKSHYQR